MFLSVNNLLKIKQTNFYKNLISIFIYPIINFFWEFILNFNGKILYYLWFFKKRDYLDLNRNDKLLVKDNKIFNEIAGEIRKHINDEVVNNAILNSKNNQIDNETNKNEKIFKYELFDSLNDTAKNRIIELAKSDYLLSTAAKYMKVFPILNKVVLYKNIKNQTNERGSMLWHKDDFGFKSLDFFISICDIDDGNGPLFCLEKKNKAGVLCKSKFEMSNAIRGERGKVDPSKDDYFKDQNMVVLKGKIGTTLLIDSFNVYHKGGHCIDKDRLMLRYSYQTPDSIRNKKNLNDEFSYYKKIRKENLKNIFHKYLFFKRSWIIEKFNLGEKLLFIYRLLHFKI